MASSVARFEFSTMKPRADYRDLRLIARNMSNDISID